MIPIVTFVAPSGTGKTTFVVRLIAELADRGVLVGAFKHDAHGFKIDKRGKDTDRMRRAGATRVGICNDREMAVYGDATPGEGLVDLVQRHFQEVDLVIAEGFRDSGVPKIVLARQDAPKAHYGPARDDVIAVVADFEIDTDRPVFSLGDPGVLAEFLMGRFGVPTK